MKVGIVGCGFVGSSGDYAVALKGTVSEIVQAIRDDERRVLTVSSLTTVMGEYKGICLSLPRVVGLEGILTELRPDLSSEEHLSLQNNAGILTEAVISLKMM